MKGIILAGGTGSRLRPLTDVTNKHLLPVGPVPMIDHPIRTIKEAGITDIMVVTGTEHAGDVFSYCGSGERFGVNINFAVQDKPNGIAGALALCQTWAGSDPIMVVLGDNIFTELLGKRSGHKAEERAKAGDACVFAKAVNQPERFGVITLQDDDPLMPIKIVEKPEHPEGCLAVTGCYIFPNTVWHIIKHLEPSGRGELEVTDIIREYMETSSLLVEVLEPYTEWSDAGTMESYRAANEFAWRNA